MSQDQPARANQTKRIITFTAVFIFIVIGFILGYSEFGRWRAQQEINKIVETARLPIIDTLKDPQSAQFKNESILSDKKTVCGEVNAKNTLGGYVGFKSYVSNGNEFLIEGATFSAWPISKIRENIIGLSGQEILGADEIKYSLDTIERSKLPDAKSYTIEAANSIQGPLFNMLYIKICLDDKLLEMNHIIKSLGGKTP